MNDVDVASTTPGSSATDSPLGTSGQTAFGVDVGGSGIKGGIVDLTTGELVGERFKIETPHPATPEAVADTIAAIVDHFEWDGPVGVTLPAVVMNGVAKTAANIDKNWIGTDANALISKRLDGRRVAVLNDADAAGLAEDKYGAGKDVHGVIALLTFGTGIGSAILHNGRLLPNTEFGHIEVGGKEAEHRAASSIKEKNDWSYKQWAPEVTRVLQTIEALIWPDLFIVGGGISRKSEKWVPLLENVTPVVPAELLNTAGIVGAAMAVTDPSR